MHFAVHVHRIHHHCYAQQCQQCVCYLKRDPAAHEAAAMSEFSYQLPQTHHCTALHCQLFA